MTFMIVDTNGYNMLMGLDFLLKIGADVMWREMARTRFVMDLG
jgi:hypothetical protein